MTILLENEENASFGFPIQEQLELLTEYVLDHEKFPYEAEVSVSIENSLTTSFESQELLLGDIVLCTDIIKSQAKEYGHSEKREFSFLVVHSLLHLLGYDHMEEEERVQMEEHQREIMSGLKIGRGGSDE